MYVLITSGGMDVPIDSVRKITNTSSGSFGSKLAKEFINQGNSVYYLHHTSAITPFSYNLDLTKVKSVNGVENLHELYDMITWAKINSSKYKSAEYKTFQDYNEALRQAIKNTAPDIILLAAAVSDYSVLNQAQNKIRTKAEMDIKLVENVKIISQIKSLYPRSFLVGFKLLVNSTTEELIKAALDSIETNRCDMVVANDLKSIKAGNHTVQLVTKKNVACIERNVVKRTVELIIEEYREVKSGKNSIKES